MCTMREAAFEEVKTMNAQIMNDIQEVIKSDIETAAKLELIFELAFRFRNKNIKVLS